MRIARNIRNRFNKMLQRQIAYSIIQHKFYYGQGGQIQLNLLNRKYQIYLETVWEDHSFLSIQGLTGVQNFNIYETESQAFFNDSLLKNNQEEVIKVLFKIPQDYTLQGKVNGSIFHNPSSVGKKIRSKPFHLQILGNNNQLNLGEVKSQKIDIVNANGKVKISSLTVQQGTVKCLEFSSQKLMSSDHVDIQCSEAYIKSLIMFGKAKGDISAKNMHIESISGECNLSASNKIKIDRYYGGLIGIKCKQILQKISIETGSGQIQFASQASATQNMSKILLGKMHSGNLQSQKNIIKIVS